MYCPILLIILASLVITIHADELYSDKYDGLDIDGILANEELRKQHENCYMDRGPCDDAAEFFKSHFPEVVATACSKCTEWQSQAFDKIADWYNKNDEATWNAFVAKNMELAKTMNIR
uniref:Chemosensory protein n=1 Tax=Meteorus pulchricornis TaxID=51522 RepID=A0A1S5VFJ5_9HYME